MTTILIRKTGKNEYNSFVCMGHAGYAKRNKPDILCAAISVLVTNTINSLEALAGEKMKVQTNEETGFISCEFQSSLKAESTFLLDSMVFGLQTLSRDYGEKYLKVNFEEV